MYVCVSIDQIGILYKHTFMKSRITMEWDFSENKPVIKVLSIQSEDVRDGIVRNFFERLGHISSWFRLSPSEVTSFEGNTYFIEPIEPENLEQTALSMLERDAHVKGMTVVVERKYSKRKNEI